jgi:hypothetical protein
MQPDQTICPVVKELEAVLSTTKVLSARQRRLAKLSAKYCPVCEVPCKSYATLQATIDQAISDVVKTRRQPPDA